MGEYVYTFAAGVIPQGSTDTFAVALEGRVAIDPNDAESGTQGTSTNGRVIFTADGSEPIERRSIVDTSKCNRCHEDLRMHGGLRVGVEFCVMCHRPGQTDGDKVPEELRDSVNPQTVHFTYMIHRIHTGENLAEVGAEYTVYGYGNRAHDFSEVRFPGRREQCGICHVPGSTGVPLPDEALPTAVEAFEDDGTGALTAVVTGEILPERATCTACHASFLANAHALWGAVGDLETCGICHGADADHDVAVVHNIGP